MGELDGPGKDRIRCRVGAGVVAVGLLAASVPYLGAEPIAARAVSGRGPFYVGQEVPVQVRAIAGAEPPQVVPPKINDAEIRADGWDVAPIAVSGIGDVVRETNRYAFRFEVIARRAGTLTIPPFTVEAGDRSGRTAPLRLTILGLPLTGRPAGFLGGVGTLEVAATATPATLRVGQDLDYRIELEGTAARGSTRRPEVDFNKPRLGFRVSDLPDEAVDDPPSRTFRFRLRPTRAGQATLPPVAIAYFDPTSGHYQVKTTPGLPIRVVDVPRFDPSALDYGRPRDLASNAPVVGVALTTSLALAAVTIALAVRSYRRRAADPRRRPARFARKVVHQLDAREGPEAVANLVAGALTHYLHLAIARPEGVLTPSEAAAGVAEATDDPALAGRAGRLIAECDRIRFGGDLRAAEEIVREAREVFRALGEEGRGGETPREAPETGP